MLAMTITFLMPIIYALTTEQFDLAFKFALMLTLSLIISTILVYEGKGHYRRVQIIESAFVMMSVWVLLAIFGSLPFIITNYLCPIDALLETISDLTATSVSFLPSNAPYILRVWQSSLMWLGSFVFLSMLVTILPEVSGCFGLELSLSQGQIFSPMIGQMREMAKKILIIYEVLTLMSFAMFRVAGLNNWDSILMAMRCISTGGGDFFPNYSNLYVEYAAIFSMLFACGNFLLYYRLFYTVVPPASSFHLHEFISIRLFAKHVRQLLLEFFILMRRNILLNCKIFFSNSEVQFLITTIFIGTFFIFFTVFNVKYFIDGNVSFRLALFHVVSYVSTTGLQITKVQEVPDFIIYFLFLFAVIGGCIGSVTGGLKIIRIIVLFKLAKMEILKALHPQMMTNVKISGVAIPAKTTGRILSFFFLYMVTFFICSVILSLSGQPFSTSVAMSIACLTSIGPLPVICDTAAFFALPPVMKLFCCFILIIGRMEIFAFLVLVFHFFTRFDSHQW